MISIESEGDFSATINFLRRVSSTRFDAILEAAGRNGAAALASATPVRSGLTANSWGYEIEKSESGATITWTNANVQNGVPIAIILQYGHGTGTGGYVAGQDYINPAIRPIMNDIAKKVEEALKV